MVSGERSGDSDELHKPISQDDARLLRIERLAQVKRGKMCNKSSFFDTSPSSDKCPQTGQLGRPGTQGEKLN